MSSVFNHAIRWELTERNPIAFEEMQKLLAALGLHERAMVFVDMPSGLRRGELAGLQWGDFDFNNLHITVTRSLVDQHVGPAKTEANAS